MNEEYSFSDWLGAPIEPPVCNNCDCEMEWQEDFVFICPVCGEDVDIDPANDIDPDEDWHERLTP